MKFVLMLNLVCSLCDYSAARKGYSLRSGHVSQCVSEEAQSKTRPLPLAQEEEGVGTSNIQPVTPQVEQQQTTTVVSLSAPSNSLAQNATTVKTNGTQTMHRRVLGKQLEIGLLGDVFLKLIEKRKTFPPPIPLCRLLPNESIRTVSMQVDMFCDSFDCHGYVDTSAPFLVSCSCPRSSLCFRVTNLDMQE